MTVAEAQRVRDLVAGSDAVIFDMDGVIIDSEPVKFSAYEEVFREAFGVRLDRSDVSWRGRTEKEVMDYWLTAHQLVYTDIQGLVDRKRSLYRAFVSESRIALIPGVLEFLGRLRADHKKIGVATASVREDQERIFRLLGIGACADTVVTLDDVRRSKPAPDIYLKAAGNLSVMPQRCLVFEDSPPGVQAALQAGMKVVVVLSSFRKDDFEAPLPSIGNFLDL